MPVSILLICEICLYCFPVLHLQNVQVIDGLQTGSFKRRNDVRFRGSKQFIIFAGMLTAGFRSTSRGASA